MFNGITQVQIGGDLSSDGTITYGYKGEITGLVVNSESLLDDSQRLKPLGNVRNSNTDR